MIILNRAVAASCASKADDIAPIIVDSNVRCRKGSEYYERLAGILTFTFLYNSSAENPFRMTDATVETPTATDTVPAAFTHGATGRKKRNGGRWDMAVDENSIEA